MLTAKKKTVGGLGQKHLHDLHVSVDPASAPFEHTRVITVDTRPPLGAQAVVDSRRVAAAAAAAAAAAGEAAAPDQSAGFSFALEIPSLSVVLANMGGQPPLTAAEPVQLPQLDEEGLPGWVRHELVGPNFEFKVIDLVVKASQEPGAGPLGLELTMCGLGLTDRKKPEGHREYQIIDTKDLGMNIGGAAGKMTGVFAGLFNCLTEP